VSLVRLSPRYAEYRPAHVPSADFNKIALVHRPIG
jgi:hypothetical protein